MMVPLMFMGCGTTNTKTMNETATSNTELTNHFWLLETLNGEMVTHPDDPRKIGFEMDATEGRVSGFAGCNNFMGSYALSNSTKIQFSQMASTKMACFNSTFDENEFLRIFDQIDSYRIDNGKLELKKGNTVLASFMKVEKANPIVNKYWKLITLDGKKVEMGAQQEREAYFTLKSLDKMVTGFGGCNTFSGSYDLKEGNQISFTGFRATLRACPDLDFNEHEFLKVFSIANTYKMEGDSLSLQTDGGETVATFEAVYFD